MERALALLGSELRMAMALCGTRSLSEVTRELLVAPSRSLADHGAPPTDTLGSATYAPLAPAQQAFAERQRNAAAAAAAASSALRAKL